MEMVMKAEIERISQHTVQAFRAALDIVVRERKHLALLEAPPLSTVQDWVGGNIKKGIPQFVALVDGTVTFGFIETTRSVRVSRASAFEVSQLDPQKTALVF